MLDQLDLFDHADAIVPVVPNTTRQRRGRLAHATGVAAEETAERLYHARGFRTVALRWRGPRAHGGSDIDLIMQRGDLTVFVEVKSRRTLDEAAFAITPQQWSRLECAAESYMMSSGMGANADMRFDVVLMDRHGSSRIIENAQPY